MKMRIEKIRSEMSIGTLLIISFVGFIVAVLLIFGIAQIIYNYQAQQEIVFSQQQLIAQNAALAVSDFIDDKFTVLETAVTLENVATVPAEDQERILGNALGSQPAFRQMALYGADGQLLARSSRLVEARSQQFLNETAGLVAKVAHDEHYISPIAIDSNSSEPLIVIAVPITNVFGDFQGMLAAELNLKFMWDLVDQLAVGETGYAYVVDRQGKLLAFTDTARVLKGENVAELKEVGAFMSGGDIDENGAFVGPGILGENTVQTFAGLGNPDWAVVTEIPTSEAFQVVIRVIIVSVVTILGVAILAAAAAVYPARLLTTPIANLTETTTAIAEGNLDLRAEVSGNLEVVQLANSFNDMAAQLQEFIGSLEQRVAARTQALETSGEVSRQISTILDRQELVKKVVELIQQSFNYYQVQIFLFDEAKENLVMVSGTGEGAQKMLANKHQIATGKGLVGRAGQTGLPVLVSDTSQADDWLPNPLLPDTQAETAVPIMSGEQIFGVLDVQQNVVGGLEQSDVALLQSIANQVAVALRNANLYDEAQKQAEREALLNQINQQILQTTDAQKAIQITIRELGRALNASHVRVQLAQSDMGNGHSLPQNGENG